MKSILVAVALIAAWPSVAQKETEVPSTISQVTVYLQGAEISHRATAALSSGVNNVVFTGLPSSLDQNTIQISSGNDVVLLSAAFRLNYLAGKQQLAEEKNLRDSIELMNIQLANQQNKLSILKAQEEMLQANKSIGGDNTGVNVEQLKLAMDYQFKKLSETKAEQLDIQQTEKKIREQLQKLNSQLAELDQRKNQPSGEIVVQVSAKNALNAAFEFSYIVMDAYWTPEYDLRSAGTASQVKLIYKAGITQSTGYDWKKVKLTLSTGNPSLSATGPILNPWYLNFGYPVILGYDENRRMNQNYVGEPAMLEEVQIKADKAGSGQTTANYTTVTQAQLNVNFEISIPYDIPSDGKPHMVAVQEYEVPATYQYYAVPKMDFDAFLIANITDWKDLNLMPGNANVFFEGTYVGKTFINSGNTKDTLGISLGRDKSIVIKREKLTDFSRIRQIGENIRQTLTYEITVRNNKNNAIQIKLMDQVPVSQNSRIEVEVEDVGGATYEQATGKLWWMISIPSNQAQKVRFTFSVKYPKEEFVPGL